MQTTSKVFMVKPVQFGFNPQTAVNNVFQKRGQYEKNAQENALREFSTFVTLLRANNVEVIVAEDTESPFTPDSIFPNNWFSTHDDGTLVLYPMCAFNRRQERKEEFIEVIKKNFKVSKTVDLTHWEESEQYLEGTGSMILDRNNKIVYACLSPRTSEKVLMDFCEQLCFTPVMFNALSKKDADSEAVPIYHTNVMMSIGTKYAIVCLESITDAAQREQVVSSLEKTGKTILEITVDQMNHFAGNMLEIQSKEGRKILIMSATARKSLTTEQNRLLSKEFRLLSPSLDFIEINGGGSARCMLAELF